MKQKCIIIGCGKWGRILKKSAKKYFVIKKIIRSKDILKKKDLKNIKWTIIATPNNTHFKYVSFCLKNKINVFCEKPLVNKNLDCDKLLKISKKFKKKLYVSDIEILKKKKILIKKNNFIHRTKSADFSLREIPKALAYHDFYLLYPILKNRKFSLSNVTKKFRTVTFLIKSNNKNFYFKYDIGSKYVSHKINKTNYITKRNYVGKMFSQMLQSNYNFKENFNRAKFALKLCNLVEKNL